MNVGDAKPVSVSGADIMARIEALAEISESAEGLTRRFLTPEHRRASDLVRGWMRDAGMSVREDAIGNVIGRYEGARTGAPALMVGSHLDTVVMAGKYDGVLGVVSGIACVDALNRRGKRLPHAVEVIGFGDEEGVRFYSTFLGSRAVAGTFEVGLLARRDAEGTSMAEALRRFGLDPARIGDAARRPADVLAYLELHIEQGPVLEAEGLPVGTVSAITGGNRLSVTVEGVAGHAGTVPMALRRDAMLAAAECALAVEQVVCALPRAVGTIGAMSVSPGAPNVIPGHVHFTVDVRAPEDAARLGAVDQIGRRLMEIGKRRSVAIAIEAVHETESVACAPDVMARIDRAISAQGWEPMRLTSGAGHDAVAMASLTDVGMIFVRCAAGISHNPDESITADDAEAGARVLLHVIESFGD